MDALDTTTHHELTGLVEAARGYAQDARSTATRRAYRADWRSFATWCAAQGLTSLPALPATVALYLSALADAERKPSTIGRALSGISEAHRAAGHEGPRRDAAVRAVMSGIRRRLGVAQRQARPVLGNELRAMVAILPATLQGCRDRALLLLGFAGAFRRSELVGLDLGDVAFTSDGVEVTLRRSKTDQEGAGRKVGVRTAPRPPRVPCAPCARGSTRPGSRRGRSSGP
jgi:site-specific recombinase XerD